MQYGSFGRSFGSLASRKRCGRSSALLAITVVVACGGTSTRDDTSNKPGPGGNGPGGEDSTYNVCDTVGPAPVRRLTRSEYTNTLKDLLGSLPLNSDSLVADGSAGIFRSNVSVPVTPSVANEYRDLAEKVAGEAAKQLGAVTGCKSASDECAKSFISDFGQRAFRRPLSEDERLRYVGLYTSLRDEEKQSYEASLQTVIAAFLQSPYFLNRIERQGAEGKLTSWDMASRLSYFLWGSMPDTALFDAAASNELLTDEGIQAQTDRLLRDPRAQPMVRSFYAQWLELEKLDRVTRSSERFPEMSHDLLVDMRTEVEKFSESLHAREGGSLTDLLTQPFGYVTPRLAAIYGLKNAKDGEVDLNREERAGILTSAAFLTLNAHFEDTSPVHRGKFVRERLLCQLMPSPPGDVQVVLPPPDPNLSTRERYQKHLDDPYCRGCHILMNPIGLAFEGYDPVGRHRTKENGLTIDTSGELGSTADIDGAFKDPIELANRLATSQEVAGCMAKHWFTFAMGRPVEDEDECTLQAVTQAFVSARLDLRSLIYSIVTSDGFRKIAPPTKEQCE